MKMKQAQRGNLIMARGLVGRVLFSVSLKEQVLKTHQYSKIILGGVVC